MILAISLFCLEFVLKKIKQLVLTKIVVLLIIVLNDANSDSHLLALLFLIKKRIILWPIYLYWLHMKTHHANHIMLKGKICYRTPLFCVICRNTLLNCVFTRTHRIAKNGKFGTFSSKLVISNKSVKLSIFGTVVCSGKCVTKLYGTWQRHNWAVCFGKRQKITVSYSKFSHVKMYCRTYCRLCLKTDGLTDDTKAELAEFSEWVRPVDNGTV
jgi:hypothetical protein